MSQLTAIIFDLDDTLFEEGSYFKLVFEKFCNDHSWSHESYRSVLSNFYYLRRNQKDLFGYFLDLNFLSWASQDKNKHVGFRAELHQELFDHYISICGSLNFSPGAIECFEYALQKGLKTCVLTNGVSLAQQNKWKCLGGNGHESIHFYPARELGYEKPDPRVFSAMIGKLNVPIQNTFFIGDKYENDLAVPVSLGANGILISHEADFFPQIQNYYRIKSLFEVPSLINQLLL
jgi:FMN phosphatase YigB (HAD superfamily)